MATDQTARVTVKVTVEMAHEQVLKLRCEYHYQRVEMFSNLRYGELGTAWMYFRQSRNTQAQLRRIAKWL